MEAWGRYWEDLGLPRTDGRLVGFLLVCEPPEQSSADLMRELRVSAASVSTATRRLMSLGLVERTTRPGDRASYFRLAPDGWLRLMEGESNRIRRLDQLAEASGRLAPDDRPAQLKRLTGFWLEEWPRILDRLRSRLEGS